MEISNEFYSILSKYKFGKNLKELNGQNCLCLNGIKTNENIGNMLNKKEELVLKNF